DNPPLPDGQLLPVRGVTEDWRRQDHRHDIHQPDVHEIHGRWRKIADRHDAFLVGEVYELDPVALARYVGAERLHSSFWFGLVESGWDPERIVTMLDAAAAASPEPVPPAGSPPHISTAQLPAGRTGEPPEY